MAVAAFSERFIAALKRNQGHYDPHTCSLPEGLNVIAYASTQTVMAQNNLWFHGCGLKLSGFFYLRTRQ